MPSTTGDKHCYVPHDWFGSFLGVFLITGLVLSYLPQIFRIIIQKNSVGLSPWFLLLGATSSASGFFNVLSLQWGVVRCCPELGFGLCLEGLLGAFQVGLQWILGLVIFGLYICYYPEEERYENAVALSDDDEDEVDDSDGESTQGEAEAEGTGSGLDSGLEATPTQSTIARYTDEELRAEEEDVSSSAFARLVPSFWPVWKAPQAHGRVRGTGPSRLPGPSPLGPGGKSSTSAVRQSADGHLAPIGSSSASSTAPRPTSSSASATPTDSPAPESAPAKKTVTISEPPAQAGGGATSSMFGLWRQEIRKKWRTKTYEWALATALAWVSVIHLIFVASITLIIVFSLPGDTFPMPEDPNFPAPVPPPLEGLQPLNRGTSPLKLLNGWATFLGVTGTALATAQYIPQLYYTATLRLVGSLSIPTMMIQTPGTAVFIYSLILRPGVNWTSILSYCFTGTLQGALLILCVVWKFRQARLGIDDFGHPIEQSRPEHQPAPAPVTSSGVNGEQMYRDSGEDE